MPLPPTYTNFVAPAIQAGNLNEVNTVIYQLLGNGTDAPVTDLEVRQNLGLGTVATQNVPLTVVNGGVSNAPVFSAYRSGAQTIPSSSNTEVVLNAVDFDSGSFLNTATGRYTPNVAGYYQINVGFVISVSGGFTLNYQAIIAKNGAPYKRTLVTTNSSDNPISGITLSGVVFLNGTTDYVSLFVFSSASAGTQALSSSATDTFMNGHFIRS